MLPIAMGTGNVLPSGVDEVVLGTFAYNFTRRLSVLEGDIGWRR